MESIVTNEQEFKAVSEQIKRFVEFYQSQGLAKHKALELAVKSVGIDCEVGMHDMKKG